MNQDKSKEIAFFNACASAEGDYDVFAPKTSVKIVRDCMAFARLPPGGRVADLGCGSGVFTQILKDLGYSARGLDLSEGLIRVAQTKHPGIPFEVGDVEHLPYENGSMDGILLSGILHHLPDLEKCAREVFRVLKPGGSFVAFDPNRMNPAMYLYRDRSSPFYSREGVTENERPILAKPVAEVFRRVGFEVSTGYLSGLRYRYIASSRLRWLLPLYNTFDDLLFRLPGLKPFSAFVITSGKKPNA